MHALDVAGASEIGGNDDGSSQNAVPTPLAPAFKCSLCWVKSAAAVRCDVATRTSDSTERADLQQIPIRNCLLSLYVRLGCDRAIGGNVPLLNLLEFVRTATHDIGA